MSIKRISVGDRTPTRCYEADSGVGSGVGPTLRIEFRARIVSYPYRDLARWEWNDSKSERLEMNFGNEKVLVLGRGLKLIYEALDQGLLRVLRCLPSEKTSETFIEAIEFKSYERTDPPIR